MCEIYVDVIKNFKLVIWNGLMGVFELDVFVNGIKVVVEVLVEVIDIYLVIGGGDFVVVVEKFNLVDKMSYIFIGGGVLLEFMEGKEFLGVVVLNDK